MKKIFLVSEEIKDFPSEHWVFENERDAKDKIGQLVGSYILDLLDDDNMEGAIEYVKEIALMGEPYGFYTKDEEVFIEELEVK